MNNMVLLGIVIVAAVLVIILIYALAVGRQRSAVTPLERSATWIDDARLDPGERSSSIVSEQIEQMVRHRLQDYPDLAGVALDFGTVPDGTIDIWVNGEQYDDPADIPDDRIRQAIKEAVAEFNRQAR